MLKGIEMSLRRYNIYLELKQEKLIMAQDEVSQYSKMIAENVLELMNTNSQIWKIQHTSRGI